LVFKFVSFSVVVDSAVMVEDDKTRTVDSSASFSFFKFLYAGTRSISKKLIIKENINKNN
jgi:hypothetical protein